MPGKVNPTQCEAMTMVCMQVFGINTTLTFCTGSGNFQLNVYMPIMYANGVNTNTYNSFVAAGYDANGTTNGVYIKDIDTLHIPNWTWTESGNKVTLTAYNGANNVVVPNVETLRNL